MNSDLGLLVFIIVLSVPFLAYNAYGLEQYKPQIEITPTSIVRYGDAFTIHAWLDSYNKPDELRYSIDVFDGNGRLMDSTLWFARQDFIYEFDTTHPAYNITEGGTYLIKVERANNMERTGIIELTILFEIVKPNTKLEPITPLELWDKHEKILDGTVITLIGQKSKPITHAYQIKVNQYFKPTDIKPSLIFAIGNTTIWSDVGDRALFYLYKKDGAFWVSPYSVKTTKNCDARDFIEISPVLPNERPPISSPAGNEEYIDPCVPPYFSEDPDRVTHVTNNDEPDTSYVKYDFSKKETFSLPAFIKKSPLPSDIRQSMLDWCADSPNSAKNGEQFWDAVPIRILLTISEFESLQGKTDSVVIHSYAAEESCPPKVWMVGTFTSENGDEHKFALSYAGDFFRYLIGEIQCKEGLTLVTKSTDGSPACVKTETKQKLIERGWALEKTPDESKPENPVTKLVLMDFVKQNMQNPFYFYKINDLNEIPYLYEIYKFGSLDVDEIQYREVYDSFHEKCLKRPDANMMNCGSLDFAFEYNSKKYWISEAGITPTPTKPTEASKEVIQTIVDSNNQFALNFYSQVSQNDENVFFSPVSISTAFAMAYEGARQDTAEEIRTMFGFPQDDGQRRAAFQSLQSGLNENEEYSLSMANALWIKQGYEISQEYIDTAKAYYDSGVDNVDFVTDEGIDIINEWVKSKTHGKIERLLEPGSTDELTHLVITNAIYFNGEWVHQFSPDWTRQSDFHVSHDKTVKASMMDLGLRKLNYAQNESLEIIELPYKGEKISMLVLLPKEIDGLNSLEENLTIDELLQWKKSLSETQIAVFLPKFTAETKYNLKNNLQDMGMMMPFDTHGADFSGINEREQLYIDEAVHKAFVGVNELGTEAAAATGIEVRATSGPPATFRADHPFIFLIQNNETGLILFMGKIVDPTK